MAARADAWPDRPRIGGRARAGPVASASSPPAAGSPHDYPAAIRAWVEAGGDVDTTAAIVGGTVAAPTGLGGRGGTGPRACPFPAGSPLPPARPPSAGPPVVRHFGEVAGSRGA
ncbi:ADP-ribosylglycohydrolase family protein [Micromonospora chalcea]|uniref:ADP-ribosylglycohydrolase family protein n=1 Tax=Micromonospora chalcea TaxID=1874 RepID=UPI003796F900